MNDFAEFRKSIRKPLTQRAAQLILKKLDELEDTEEGKIEVLNQSIRNGWQGIFPLKDRRQERRQSSRQNTEEFYQEIGEWVNERSGIWDDSGGN